MPANIEIIILDDLFLVNWMQASNKFDVMSIME